MSPALEPRARLVELVGPAGAGKSTLSRVLPACDARFTVRRGVWYLPRLWLVVSMFAIVPTLLVALCGGRPLRGPELAQMIRLDALRRCMARARRRGNHVIVLDEGPVFALAWLDLTYRRNGDPGWAAWRRRMIGAWGGGDGLDAVVRMDADDTVLTRRIKARVKSHRVKDAPPDAIAAFTRDFRQAYDRVVGELAERGVRVALVDTDGGNVTERADRLVAAIRETLDERS
jgi:adenylate kinase family enzyme